MSSNEPKILFYTFTPRAFRTTLIYYLYELAQVYPVILLSEKLDPEIESILQDQTLFPKLQSIIPVNQFSNNQNGIFVMNKNMYSLAEENIRKYQPDVVISATDTYSLFELYLMSAARKLGALRITIQPTNVAPNALSRRWVNLTTAYLSFPSFIPTFLKLALIECKRYFGHFFYYWLLPLSIGVRPFGGRSSFILRRGNSGMRDSNYQIVFSERDRRIYEGDGVPRERLIVLAHPLFRKPRVLLRRIVRSKRSDKKTVYIILSSDIEIGFQKEDGSPINRRERHKEWAKDIALINKALPEWEIRITMHPDTKNPDYLKRVLLSAADSVKVNPPQNIEEQIQSADIVIGFPLSASTVLFIASLIAPEKPLISLDFHKEMMGDYYKEFEGIEYVTSKERFLQLLELIKGGKYKKNLQSQSEESEFSNLPEMIDQLLTHRAL